MAIKKILTNLEIDGSIKASSTVESEGGNLHSYGGDVAFDAFQGYDGIRELATDEYVIPFLGAPHVEGQGNLGAGTTNSRAGVSTYIETAKYNFTTNDQIPYGVMWVRRAGKAMISLIAKTKDEAASHISSRLKVGYTPADNYGDQTNTNVLDVNGNIHAVSSVSASSFIKDGGTSSQFLKANGSVDSKDYIQAHEVPYTEQIALSDETTALTTGTSKVTFRSPGNITASLFRLSCATAPTGSVITVDVNVEGVSILSTKLTIDAGEKTSRTAVTAMQFVTGADVIGNDNEITIDIDGIGSTIAGAGLKLIMYYNYSVVLP